MRFNKTVAKAFVFALGLGAVSFLGVNSAKAAQAGPADVVSDAIKFNGNSGTFSAKKDDSKAEFWGIAKKLKNEKGANFYDGVSKEFYSITEIDKIVDNTVDISAFAGKTVTIGFGSTNSLASVKEGETNDKWTLKTIKAADKTFNIGYAAKEGEKVGKIEAATENAIISDYGVIAAYHIKDKAVTGLNPDTENAKYEVRVGEGEWKAIVKGQAPADTVFLFESLANKAEHVNPVFQSFTQNGSSLYFRLKATEDTWPGEAKKVTFKKRPGAPKITLDSSKDSSNIKHGMKVTLNPDTSANNTNDKSPAEGITKASFEALGINTIVKEKTGSLTIYTDAGKGKIKSKETVITLVRPADPSWVVAATAEGQSHSLINDLLSFDMKVKYDITKGGEIVNKDTTADYEFYVEHKTDANDKKVKWTKVKRAKSKTKPTKINVKYSAESKPFTFGDSDSKLYIRKAGSKQNGNYMLLPSVTKAFDIKLKNVEQTMAAAGTGVTGNLANSRGTLTIANIPKEKDSTYKITFTMGNRVSIKAPKIKVTSKVPGVSVKAGKFSATNVANIEIKINKKVFPKEGAAEQSITFVYTAEGLKNKEVTVKLTPAA